MNRRVIIFFTLLISFFVFSSSVKADSDKVISYNSSFDRFKELDYLFGYGGIDVGNAKEKMNELVETLKSNNIHFVIETYMQTGTYKQFSGIRIYELSSSQSDVTYSLRSNSCTSSECSFRYTYSNFVTNIALSTSGLSRNNQSQLEARFDTLIDYVNTNKHLPTTTSAYVDYYKLDGWEVTTAGYTGVGSNYNSDMKTFVWSSNVDLKLKFSGSTFSGIQIGSNIYRADSLLPSYMNTPSYGKTYYTFNENINTLGNSQVRFKFDVPSDKIFSFFFNYSVTYSNLTTILPPPYLEYTIEDAELIEHIYSLPFYNHTKLENETVYNDTQINTFREGVLSFEFVVDLENKKELEETVSIFFESEYPFTYEYITDSNYVEVDWSGNYGILLIPKKYNSDDSSTIRKLSTIYYKGAPLFWGFYKDINDISKFDLSYLTKATIEFKPFSELFSTENLNETLFIIYEDYQSLPDTTIIKYDTRYFNHSVCKNKDSCDIVSNPNTGENVTPKPPTVLTDEDDDFFTKLMNRILDPIYEKLPIIKQLPDVWGVFLQAKKNPKAPNWSVDLSGIGFNTVVYMDFTFFDQYRSYIFFIIQLSATYVTLKKLIDIIAKYFN